ncbi:phosphoglycerate dehydrogenase [Staphylococcus auricularis]|uniref:phosphoglycerate dehydrogenase n=1 Tax=Staphylococcus auricularis TaxID=29379 RepID=UPI001EF37646|nr:phosphoglycerate dehydrogenase [Staphylococcus auricularis]MCG7340883.1 phosphoglycerate dehydrogenase [Staphylococcus auricularis]
MYKILVADAVSTEGLSPLLQHEQFEVEIHTQLTEAELIDMIPDYEGLIVRSQTQVTKAIIQAATQLKVIARAGVGVDNIDLDEATKHGIIVINAPEGNTISATEHSMAMLLSMARHIPKAHHSLQSGEWNRKAFKGTELYNKTLGSIGTGRIGLGVAKRAQSFGMHILAHDPYLSEEKAQELGIERSSISDIAREADFVTVHTPLTAKTRGIIDYPFFERAKPTLQIINVARGGIINEQDLVQALDEELIARAAIDVFENEPATASPLTKHDKVIVTPHLGASTVEAEEKAADSVSNEIIALFEQGTIRNAVNAPKMSIGEIDEHLQPFVSISETIAQFAVQLIDEAPRELHLTYRGTIAEEDTSILTRTLVKTVLQQDLGTRVNLINALVLLNEQGVKFNIEKDATQTPFQNAIELTLYTEHHSISLAATVVKGYGPRIVRINDYAIDFKPGRYQLVIHHTDQPGIIGQTGQILGHHDINIGNMHVGRADKGGDAFMILSLDSPVKSDIIEKLYEVQRFKTIHSVYMNPS